MILNKSRYNKTLSTIKNKISNRKILNVWKK